MTAYFVYYEDLIPGPRTFYFSGPIRKEGADLAHPPAVGDLIEFRNRHDPVQAGLRAQIRSIEPIDETKFRFAADPVEG